MLCIAPTLQLLLTRTVYIKISRCCSRTTTYSLQCAHTGLNVVLISRTEAKLQTAAAEIEQKYKVQTKYVVADFGAADGETWEAIRAAAEGLDVGVLVNNVGLSYDHAEYYDAVDEALIDNLINVNIQATNKVPAALLQLFNYAFCCSPS